MKDTDSSLVFSERSLPELSAKESVMLHTYLTTSWHLRYPIIGAPVLATWTIRQKDLEFSVDNAGLRLLHG